MILETKYILGRGAYADVFTSPGHDVVYKLFVSEAHQTNRRQGLTRPEDELRRRKTFDSQCEAFHIASRDPFLRQHIPRFHGRVPVEDVRQPDGSSVAQEYILDCCYAIDLIAGDDMKISGLGTMYEHIADAERAFRAAGIHHLIDASVFAPDSPDSFKFIDFATEEFEAFW